MKKGPPKIILFLLWTRDQRTRGFKNIASPGPVQSRPGSKFGDKFLKSTQTWSEAVLIFSNSPDPGPGPIGSAPWIPAKDPKLRPKISIVYELFDESNHANEIAQIGIIVIESSDFVSFWQL